MDYRNEIESISRTLVALENAPAQFDNVEYREERASCEKHGEYTQRIRVLKLMSREVPNSRTECPLCLRERLTDLQDKQIAEDRRTAEFAVNRLMYELAIPERFSVCTLENYEPVTKDAERALKVCRAYANKWPERLKQGGGLVMCGKPGTGKNHLALAIAKQVIAEHQSPVIFTTALRIARDYKSTWSKGSARSEDDVIRYYTQPDLLIIDEVGVQFGSEAEKLIMFEIVNTRYEKMKPTILISNQTKEELAAFIGERVIDRMNDGGGCTLSFTWDSYRERKQ